MLQAYVTAAAMYWHTLRGALRARRDSEEGMATTEVLLLAAGLVLLAGVIAVFLKTAANDESKSLP